MESSSGRPRLAYVACVLAAIALGLWLRWPTLHNGFVSDDYVFAAMLEGTYPAPRAALDLFTFADGSHSDNARLTSYGALPWWTVSGLRLAMMRPLSSALVVLDRALFGNDAFAYHVHSMVWWVLLMGAVAALLRALFPAPVACLSIVMFALEEGHTLPLGWLANRGAMVAMVFGVLGVLAHVRARQRGSLAGHALSFGCFSVALLSGEWAFPLLGYVLAYELVGRTDALRVRLLALLPSAAPGFVFLLARAHLRYGALKSGVYIDPITEPATFFIAACQRIPVFFADLFFSVPANWWGLGTPWRDRVLGWQLFSPQTWLRLPSWHFWHVVLGGFAMVATYVTLRAGLRDRAADERAQIRWMLVGALLSLVPMVASFPTSRLVLPAAVAASAAAALIVLRGVTRFRELWPTARVRACAALSVAAVVCHFQVWEAGHTSYIETRVANHAYASVKHWLLDAEIDDTTIARQHLVLLTSAEHTSTIFLPFVRAFFGHPMPLSSRVLSASPHAHDVYRPAPNVLELSVLGGTMLSSDLETLYRDDRFPFHVGETVRLPGLTAYIVRMLWGKPQTVRFVFDKSVDDPSYRFLVSSPEGFVRARLPEVGQRVRYRKPTFPDRELARFVQGERDPNVRCLGPRPPIEECRVGYFYADCGGSSAPVFACHGHGDCRFFSRGCVAEGYVTSLCSAHELGCENGTPFPAQSWLSRAPYDTIVSRHLQTWGGVPWDGERDMHVSVAVEPRLAGAWPELGCRGPDRERGPCGAPMLEVPSAQQSSLRFAFLPPHAAPGWLLAVEVVDSPLGELHARVCKVELADTALESLASLASPTELRATPPVCAIAGDLVLSRFPVEVSRTSELSARLVADFADGLHVEAEF